MGLSNGLSSPAVGFHRRSRCMEKVGIRALDRRSEGTAGPWLRAQTILNKSRSCFTRLTACDSSVHSGQREIDTATVHDKEDRGNAPKQMRGASGERGGCESG